MVFFLRNIPREALSDDMQCIARGLVLDQGNTLHNNDPRHAALFFYIGTNCIYVHGMSAKPIGFTATQLKVNLTINAESLNMGLTFRFP